MSREEERVSAWRRRAAALGLSATRTAHSGKRGHATLTHVEGPAPKRSPHATSAADAKDADAAASVSVSLCASVNTPPQLVDDPGMDAAFAATLMAIPIPPVPVEEDALVRRTRIPNGAT